MFKGYSEIALKLKETGYTTLVRPLLEYRAPVWSPHLVTQILAVEIVQHRAARFVKGNFQWTDSVTEMLRSQHWDTLGHDGKT